MAPGVPGKRQLRPAGAGHEDRFPDALRCRRRRWEPGRSACGGADLTDAEVRHVLQSSDVKGARPGKAIEARGVGGGTHGQAA